MEIIIHDLKNDRQNVSGGLPSILKLVPIAFYIGTVLSILLSLYFYFSFKAYKSSAEVMKNRATNATGETQRIQQQDLKIREISTRANQLAQWLEGSRPLQPITVAIARSMAKNSTIAELSLNRNPEIPAHTFMELKVNGGGSQQVQATLDSIYALNYQTYSAQEVKGKNAIDFQATLIYNEKN